MRVPKRKIKNPLLSALLLVVGLAVMVSPFSLQTTGAVEKPIPPAVLNALHEEPFVSVIVTLESQSSQENTPDSRQPNHAPRKAVVQGLKDSAQAVESEIYPSIQEEMEKGNITSYESLWAVNAFTAEANLEGLKRIAGLPPVINIQLDRSFALTYPSAQPARENQRPGLSSTDLASNEGLGAQVLQEGVQDEQETRETQVLQEAQEEQDTGESQETQAPSPAVPLPWNLEQVNAPKAWNEGFYGDGVVVAIMDTGVDPEHPSLSNQYRGNLPGHSHETSWFDATGEHLNNNEPLDQTGHGTHVAGIILGGTPDNPLGVAPNARWIGVNIFTRGHAWESHIIKAFQWLMAPGGNPDHAPDIVNCSWATRPDFATDDLQWELLHNLEKAGIFIVFAAGNNAGDGPGSPAGYPHAFSVGAVTQKGDEGVVVADFSSKGPIHWDGIKYTKPEITAPGTGIRSAWLNGGFSTMDGTSMAAAHVSGVSALLLQSKPGLSPGAVRHILLQTAYRDPVWADQEARPDNAFGYGVVDAQAAVGYDRSLLKEEDVIFFDNAEEGLVRWSTSPNQAWHITREKAWGGTFAFADSPWGQYASHSQSWIALSQPVSLCGYHSPSLHFHHTYDFATGGERKDDFGYVEYSTDGRLWSRVYRFSGSNEGFEPFSVLLHPPHDAEKIYLRFRIESNNSGTGKGWYIDDIALHARAQPLTELDELQLDPQKTLIGLNQSVSVDAKAVFCRSLFRDIDPKQVLWRSTNPSVASVRYGVITGHTPGNAVIRGTFAGKTADLQVSVVEINAPEPSPEPGTYVNGVDVQLNPVYPGSTIHYTLDGSEPDRESPELTPDEVISLENTTTIKARAYLENIPGPVSNYAYSIVEGADVTGQISLQGRARVDDELSIFFLDQAGMRYGSDRVTLSESGHFSTALPLGPYTLVVERKQYLTRILELELTLADEPVELPPLELLAGDVTGSNRVGVADLARLSLAYRATSRDEHWDAMADLNGDGVVNMLDLDLLSQNYGLEGDAHR